MHDKENELKLEKELYNSPVLYEWEYSGFHGNKTQLTQWLLGIFIPFFPISILLLLINAYECGGTIYFYCIHNDVCCSLFMVFRLLL